MAVPTFCATSWHSHSVELVRNLMAHAQKPHFVFRLNGRVHLNRRGRKFSRLLAAEVCASALVMLDTPRSEVVWEYWLPTPFASYPFTSPPVRHRVPPHSERSIPQLAEPTFSVPFLGFSSPLVAFTGFLPVQKRIKTSSKMFIKACKTFSSSEPSIPLGCADENDCGGELGGISLQRSSPKRIVRHFVLKKILV